MALKQSSLILMQHIQFTGVQSCSLLLCLNQIFSPERHCLAVLSVYKGDKSGFYLTYPCDDSLQLQGHLYGFYVTFIVKSIITKSLHVIIFHT